MDRRYTDDINLGLNSRRAYGLQLPQFHLSLAEGPSQLTSGHDNIPVRQKSAPDWIPGSGTGTYTMHLTRQEDTYKNTMLCTHLVQKTLRLSSGAVTVTDRYSTRSGVGWRDQSFSTTWTDAYCVPFTQIQGPTQGRL
ncbi:hypothetical protein RRG08_046217 [Elysia crispata]|uniref:Uncharacterized protein n=1 Tax=Elysia crispata TaxID=231223 RepID=A0AAE0YN07_9GAST|nr:hypothetical protein RRG08_046217 [Elysia crispata]